MEYSVWDQWNNQDPTAIGSKHRICQYSPISVTCCDNCPPCSWGHVLMGHYYTAKHQHSVHHNASVIKRCKFSTQVSTQLSEGSNTGPYAPTHDTILHTSPNRGNLCACTNDIQHKQCFSPQAEPHTLPTDVGSASPKTKTHTGGNANHSASAP